MLAAIDAGLLRHALVVARRGCTATPCEGGDGPMQPPPPLSPETLAAQALGDVDPVSGGLTPGINPSTSYEQLPDGSYRQDRVYTRADNPTYETAEGLLAALEGAGCAGALFASGMAAATATFQSLLPGDHVLVSRVLYWGVRKWLAEFALTWGLDVEFVDTGDHDAVSSAIRPGRTRLLWVETPANPMWEITDLAGICELAHAAGVRVAVDNTVATPVLTRPLELGADLVVHSATKYLNGHSDVLAGAVLTARRDPFWERIRSWRRNAGAVPGPFEAWLLQRGMRTLFLRVHRSSDSAMAIARHLHGHPSLAAVLYPGLPSHPGHQIAARQMHGGFGGMLSIRLAGGAEQAMAVLGAVRVFKRATSLGGDESLIEHRRSQEGPSSPVPEDLLRLSIGIEAPEDLLADLDTALAAAHPTMPAAPQHASG
jgi:cystathionine gamma-synthase